jgi:hypothetical protein
MQDKSEKNQGKDKNKATAGKKNEESGRKYKNKI